MIDEQIAISAAAAFLLATSKRWPQVRTEIQDNGTFLLLSVDVPSNDTAEIDLSTRQRVVNTLNTLMPITAEEPVGNWIVGFLHDGNVYDSILANEF